MTRPDDFHSASVSTYAPRWMMSLPRSSAHVEASPWNVRWSSFAVPALIASGTRVHSSRAAGTRAAVVVIGSVSRSGGDVLARGGATLARAWRGVPLGTGHRREADHLA